MSIFSAFAVLSSGTLLSRALGFVRDFLMAVAVGPGLVSDVFVVAFRFPNIFRRLFAEGAFEAAFVPQFSRKSEHKGLSAAYFFGNHALSWMVIFMVLFCGLMIFLMPRIVPILVPGFSVSAEKLALTIALSRIMFPYLFCMAVSALFSGILAVSGRFSAKALSPVILNVFLIIVLWGIYSDYGWSFLGGSAKALAWSVLAAGILQLLWLFWHCRRLGFRYRFLWPRLDADMKLLLCKMLPVAASAAVIQINLLVGDFLASLLGSKAISWLFFADRLVQLPLGVVGVAVAVAALPRLSESVQRGDRASTAAHIATGLRVALFFATPAAAGLLFMPQALMSGLFGYGAFSPADVVAAAYALRMAAVGVIAFVIVKIFLAVFFAYQDTKTPALIAVGVVVFNGVSAYILMRFMGHGGIALAGSLAACANMLCLGVILWRRGYWHADAALRRFLCKIIILVALMLAILAIIGSFLGDLSAYDGAFRFVLLFLWIIPAASVYLFLGWRWGCLHTQDLKR